MARINVIMADPRTGERKLAGWFDTDRARRFDERREAFDGANLAGVHLRDQNRGQVLWYTAGGRWVLETWSRWQDEPDDFQFVGADTAREWLLVNGDDDAVERIFGEPQLPESGPGRPEIGPTISVRLPQEMIDKIDALTGETGTRAETIRALMREALAMSA